MLGKLKRLIQGRPDLDAYEEKVLEQEHQKLQGQIQRIEARLDHVQCASCVKKEEPAANRLIAQKRALLKTMEDIEWKLGYTPEADGQSRRTSKRR
ncbi:MAG: hypothetical protein R3185_01365 [Candidatus Thermoplasmatota archaeon]|nr:hypothetical protein [Candidatus Thermoplasmatota archaeon]